MSTGWVPTYNLGPFVWLVGGFLGPLVDVLIICIVVGAIIYIASLVLPIPPKIIQILWIVFVVIVAIYAIRFLALQL